MKSYGLPLVLGSVLLVLTAAQPGNGADFLAMRGTPAAPVHTTSITLPENRIPVQTLFGPVKYLPWKNSCIRVAPVVAGQRLVFPELKYSHAPRYLPVEEEGEGFLNAFVQALFPAGQKPREK